MLTCRRCRRRRLASIFKRMSDVPDLDYNTSQDFTAAYKVSSLGFFCPWLIRVVEIHRLQKDADDCREARTHTRDRRAIYPRAFDYSHFFLF